MELVCRLHLWRWGHTVQHALRQGRFCNSERLYSSWDLPALHFSFCVDRFVSGCGALWVCFQLRFVYSHQFMVIAVIALLSELTLTRFDGHSHCSVVGSSSGILIVHALSLSLLLSFSSSILVQPEDCQAFQH